MLIATGRRMHRPTDPIAQPVFARAALQDLFGIDTAVIDAVLATFMQSMRTSVAELGPLLVRGELSAIANIAHRVKGASRMSGAMAMAQAAESLERAAAAGDVALVHASVGELDRQWGQFQKICPP
ncbi:MAG: Hpt domain-containing protein [Rhodoferax sp.]|nr:Hpt domain-containing protein [Rhodoferax sp.]